MDSVIPAVEVPALEVGFWSSLMDVLARFLRGTALSDAQRHRLHLAAFAATRFGAPLLAAESQDDLDDRIDTVISDPEILKLAEFGIRTMDDQDLTEIAADASSPAAVAEVLGRATLPRLEEGLGLMVATMKATVPLLRTIPGNEMKQLAAAKAAAPDLDQLAFLSNPRIPAEVAESLLAGLRATVCALAITQTLISRRRPQPWLALAVAERWVEGQRSLLRLLASIPGTDIPETLVPAAERFNMEALIRRTHVADQQMGERLSAARASGEPVFPPHAEPGEEPPLA